MAKHGNGRHRLYPHEPEKLMLSQRPCDAKNVMQYCLQVDLHSKPTWSDILLRSAFNRLGGRNLTCSSKLLYASIVAKFQQLLGHRFMLCTLVYTARPITPAKFMQEERYGASEEVHLL